MKKTVMIEGGDISRYGRIGQKKNCGHVGERDYPKEQLHGSEASRFLYRQGNGGGFNY
jgi:hypothetical protein